MNSPTVAWIPAHELGHALGLGDSDNPKDLMFHYTYGTSLTPSSEDFSTLSNAYGSTPIPEYSATEIPLVIAILFGTVIVRSRKR